jgi:signal transduction histidine kinase
MRSLSLKGTVRFATIAAIAGCAVVIIATAGAIYTLERAESRVAFANALISDAGKLNLLTTEMMIHNSGRVAHQWGALQERLIHRLNNAPQLQDTTAGIIFDVTDRLRSVKALVMRKDGLATPGAGPMAGEALEILRSTIISQSHAILESAGELHHMTTVTAARTRSNALLLLGGGLLLFLTGGGTALLLLSRDMLEGILRLRSTIQKLGQGDLEAEIPGDVPNEMGDVFAELDGMRYNLLNSMSELGRANLELISTKSKLEERSTSLEAVNRELEAFTSAVSHDLRAPLRTIMGFSDAVIEDYSQVLDKDGRDMLGRVNRAARQMYQLIDDLLRLSKLGREKLHLQEVNISALAEDVCRTVRERNPERQVKVSITPGMTAKCDEQLMRIALTNLLDNAWKFTLGADDPHVEIGTEIAGGVQRFFIQDNGAGFDMSFSESLFKPFKRLHSAAEFPGTGVGLATVSRIINLHGGSISAAAQPGEGARFTFRLAKPPNFAATDPEQHETAESLDLPAERPPRRAAGRS